MFQIKDLEEVFMFQIKDLEEVFMFQIKDLEEELENSVSTKRIEDMETRLEVATEEISSKTKQIKEMEEWKKKLETDCKQSLRVYYST